MEAGRSAGGVLRARAPAKINLSLAVHGRRADGYHELTSLVAFAGVGDSLSLMPHGPGEDRAPALTLSGPYANRLAADPHNLVLRAARALREAVPGLRTGDFALVKRLPIASGIGGGSADAAAALRLLARLNRVPSEHPALGAVARATGADVPVCLSGKACVMSGVGEALGPPLALPPLFAVLVNPGVAVSTAAVFAALGLEAGQAHRDGATSPPFAQGMPPDAASVIAALAMGPGNDLEEPARRIAPAVEAALAVLATSGPCRLARMSGSGATCFGIFDNCRDSAEAARRIRRAQPGWWVTATVLR